jgi:hypothetical protein
MMMMSSNTVGNNDFNTAGITPLNAKKPQAKKEATLKLANAKPDSFERTQPRDTTPEAPPTVEASAKAVGNSGLVGTILGGLGLVASLGFGWFAVSKGEEAKVAKTAVDTAKTLAETAQKEVAQLTTKVTELAGKVKVSGVSEQRVQGLIDLAVNGKLDESGVKQLISQALKAHPKQKDIETLIDKSLTKNNETERDAIAELVMSILDDNTVETEEITGLKQRVEQLINHLKTGEVHEELESNQSIWDAPLQASEILPVPESPKIPTVVITPRTFPVDVQPLFEFPDKITEPPAFLALKKKQQRSEDGVTSLDLINNIFSFIDDELPTDIARLSYCASPTQVNDDAYKGQMFTLTRTATEVSEFYRGKINKEQLTATLNCFLRDDILRDDTKEAIVTKAQAVVDGQNPVEVKAAQKNLVTLLKETFGKTKAEQFKADYPNGVRGFTPPPHKEAPNGWVLEHFNPQKSFDEMAEVILTGGLHGNDKTNNTVKSADTLATVVLPNLIDQLQNTYSDSLRVGKNDRIFIRDGEKVEKPIENLVNTLEGFRQALQPIDSEVKYDKALFHIKTPDEIETLPTEELKLQARMINARLKGNTPEGQAEMETVTADMYNLLRTQLKALNKAESAVVPEVEKAVDVVAETLVQGIPLTVKNPNTQDTQKIFTFGQLLTIPYAGNTKNFDSILREAGGILDTDDNYKTLDLTPTKKGAILQYFKNIGYLKNDSVLDTCVEGLTNKEEIISLLNTTVKKYQAIQSTNEKVKPIPIKDTIKEFLNLIIAGLPKEASS